MSSSIRIKVQVGEDKSNTSIYKKTNPFRKFVYVINSPLDKTIHDLIANLQEYISQKFSFTKTQIVDLKTYDGYSLSKLDKCSDVIKDNDHILCIDMEKFMDEYYSKCRDVITWLELKQFDASDEREKFIRIGLNNFSELFVRMHGTTNVAAIYIFGIHELMTIVKKKRTTSDNLIARLDSSNDYDQISTTDWFLETKWEYDTVLNKDLFIICNLKVGSNEEVYSEKLHVRLDHLHMRIEKGEIIHLSGELNDSTNLTDQQRQRLKELTSNLPPLKRTGPEINLNMYDTPKLSKYECEGESSIRMAFGNTNTVNTYQGRETSDDETFGQDFIITHIIFSKRSAILPEILQQKRAVPADKPVSVVSLTIFYQIHDGSWRECQEIAIAPIGMQNEESKWLTDSIINIEPDKLLSFTIKGRIIIKGEPCGSDELRQRIHKSLPQPLKLKIVVTDNFSKQCSLIIECLNKPLELLTRELFLKNNQSSIIEILAFIYADDCENDERICMAMYISTDKKLVIKKYDKSYKTYDRRALRMMEYNAKQNKTTEVLFKEVDYRNYTKVNKAFGLFDPETYMLYAIRLEVSTKTSKTEETVIIPMDKIM